MRRIVLANETDWEGWRKAARSLVMAGVVPEDVRWSVRSHDEEGDPLAGRDRQLRRLARAGDVGVPGDLGA